MGASMHASLPAWAEARIGQEKDVLARLLSSSKVFFDEKLWASLPEQQGLYLICRKEDTPGETLRAGRTKTAIGGLRQRVYQNHFMGTQKGNLRQQLVQGGLCGTLGETKDWIRKNCYVTFLVVEDESLRARAEHFMLSILRPRFCD